MASHGVPRVTDVEHATDESRQQEASRIRDYKNSVATVEEKVNERQYTTEVLDLTSKLLKLNPEYYTIWNHRRRILQFMFPTAESDSFNPNTSRLISELIINDLRFLVPLLIKFSKCYWIWNHRLWLLQQASNLLPSPDARMFWQDELGLTSKMLGRDSRNFHGWGYRRLIISKLESKHFMTENTPTSMTKEEFDYATRMIHTNMSNFSAWHNRGLLIPKLLDEINADNTRRQAMLNEELEIIEQALYTDPYDQSLWFYHQFLMGSLAPPSAALQIAPNLSTDNRRHYIATEIGKIVEMLEGTDDCKWIYQSLIYLSMTYRRTFGVWPENAEPEGLLRWMQQLEALDPLRSGRWADLRNEMKNLTS